MKAVQPRFAGKSVNLAVSPRDYYRPSSVSKHIVHVMETLGCRSRLVADGNRSDSECDLLILYGNCRTLWRYPRLLGRRSANRPRIAMWQYDPLPPRSLDPALERHALNFAGLFAHHRLLRPLEMIFGLPLYHTIAKRGLGPFSDRTNGYVIDPLMARTTVETYAAIRRGLAEGWLDRSYMSTIGKQLFLAERGINAGFAPIGYYPGLGEDRRLERDIDVLFIGTLKKQQRLDRLRKLINEIEKAGARIKVVDKDVYGDARIELLNRTKIVLHIHKYPWDTPWMRWTVAAANGALMVSEPLEDPAPFEPGVHYFEAPADRLPATVAHLLANPDILQTAAARCGDFIREKFTLRGAIERILSDFFPSDSPTPRV